MPKEILEAVPVYTYNPVTGMIDADVWQILNGERVFVRAYSLPIRVAMENHAAMGAALKEFAERKPVKAVVVPFAPPTGEY